MPLGSTTAKATVLGIENERFFPASGAERSKPEFMAIQTQMSSAGVRSPATCPNCGSSLCRGGENGAFGAGLLCG